MKGSKFAMLPGLNTTPTVFCAKLLERAHEIEQIACVVMDKDGTTNVYSTTMPSGDAAWLRCEFDRCFPRVVERD